MSGGVAPEIGPDVVLARLHSQMLAGEPGTTIEGVAGRILAIQGQDPRGARLAIRARSVGSGISAADVDRALTAERSIVITWLNRGTLHLVRSEDYFWLHALMAHRYLPWTHKRLRELGVPPDQAERSVEIIVAALEADGALTRAEISERLVAAGVPTGGQAIYHQIGLASFHGLIVRGPMRGREQCLVLTRDWLGEAPPFDRETALAELARRYLAGHAPASERDLAYWSGLPLTEARAAFRTIGAAIVERGDGLVDLADRRADGSHEFPPPRLLGPFDPLLHGWASRDFVLGPHQSLVTMNGIFKATLFAGGRAVGTWGLAGGRVRLEPFEEIPADVEAGFITDALDVERYMRRS